MRSYVNFMAKRELIANKIEKFDNSPVNYHTWQASFNNMIRNVRITPSEEFSWLVEYTTLSSKSLVLRLRNAYIGKPHEGITELWKKLDERYGCSGESAKIGEKNHPNLCLNPAEDNMNVENKRTKLRQTYKTDVTRVHYSPDRKSSDPGQWCVVHRKPNPINQCRVSRAKPMEERRALLKHTTYVADLSLRTVIWLRIVKLQSSFPSARVTNMHQLYT